MSTYKYTDEVGDTLEVYTSASRPDAAIVTARDNEGGDVATVIIPKADVPHAALALLKAAGYKETGFADDSMEGAAGWTIRWLQIAVDHAERDAEAARKAEAEAEAADKARLDQEALVLHQALTGDMWAAFINEAHRDLYRRVALAARELHKDGGLNVIEEHSEGVCSDASNTLCRECISTADAEDGNK